jgi:hypothetical protein
VHPAFSGFLGDANAALQPVAAEIAGLPGAPVRAEQVSSGEGVRAAQGVLSGGMPIASLSPAARHAWLVARLPALRAGAITLAQMP